MTAKEKQPLSLRWKWGIILLICFNLIGLGSVGIISSQMLLNQRQNFEERNQDQYERIQKFISNQEKILKPELFELDNDHMSQDVIQTINFLNLFKDDTSIIRLLDKNEQLIYQTDVFLLDDIKETSNLYYKTIENEPFFIGKQAIYSQKTHEKIGQLEYITSTKNLQLYQQELIKKIVVIGFFTIVVSTIVAFGLSTYFLRPLTYLNNALDRVEEESLSDIRLRKPRSSDEWNDLSVHVNRLLDRIDGYVSTQKQFVEDVSHELRTPVAVVEGHLKMLNRWGKDDPEILEESISASLQEITRMKELVQEMLDLSRAEHVDQDFKDEVTEVYSTTQQVFNNFKMIYPDFNFYLDSDESRYNEAYVSIYRNHFEQILIILIDNAVKYSKDRKEVHISIAQSFRDIEIAIQDFGVGMSQEDLDKVFERFYRVDKARSRDKGGNGLGLSIAKKLVQGYKGHIRADSVIDSGSIFYVSLPLIKNH